MEAKLLLDDIIIRSKHSEIKLVYYSWIVNSICTDTVALLENYMIDFVSSIMDKR